MKPSFLLKTLMASVFFLGFAMTNAFAELELVISPEQQSCQQPDGNGTCWAACCYMVLDAYSYSTTQAGIVNWAVNNTCSDNAVSTTCSANCIEGTCTAVDMVLENFGPIGSSPVYGNLSQSDLIYEIDQGRPIIAHWQYSNYGHDLLIKGYDGAGGSGSNADVGNVIYNDPLNGARKIKSFAEFVQTGNYPKWDETLRLTTNPDYPIPTPIGGSNWVQVNTGGTTVVTPTTSSLSYSASSCCQSITWNWNLIFTDVNGPVVVASSSQPTDNNHTTTWNITNFAMPAGHQWYYNYNGKIPGRVELSATIGSEQVHDGKDVIFVPSVLYPGYIVFANQTVSSSHADVKAHTSVSLTNDAITSTGNVSFKAGNKININDGVTIQNGAVTNFIIDPGLQ
ncbi:MAG TPA: hypothetical protein DCO75_11870 [Fibrobacteres bacterium]|jgi:hypothetical protein|nr:hypothetical protein [Fibrobacterota bacterium]